MALATNHNPDATIGQVTVFEQTRDNQTQIIGKTSSGKIALPCKSRRCPICHGIFNPELGRAEYQLEKRQGKNMITDPATGKRVQSEYFIFHRLEPIEKRFSVALKPGMFAQNPPPFYQPVVYSLGDYDQVGGIWVYVYQGYAIIVDCGAITQTQDYDNQFRAITRRVTQIPALKQMIKELNLKVAGIFITHGHLDHYGAWAYLGRIEKDGEKVRLIDTIPTFSSRITWQYMKKFMEAEKREEIRSIKKNNSIQDKGTAIEKTLKRFALPAEDMIKIIKEDQVIEIGNLFKLTAFSVPHSIPEALGFKIEVGGKTIIHLGDFKFQEPEHPEQFKQTLREIAKGGVDEVILDALNAGNPGMTEPASVALDSLKEIIAQANPEKYPRVLTAFFASDMWKGKRLREIAANCQRQVIIKGRSQKDAAFIGHHFYGFDKLPIAEKPEGDLILLTGCQAEDKSALWNAVFGRESSLSLAFEKAGYDTALQDQLKIQIGDLVVISSRCIPGNEVPLRNMTKELLRQGADVVIDPQMQMDLGITRYDGPGTLFIKKTHVSGHGRNEDIINTVKELRPRKIIPAHCESEKIEVVREILPEDYKDRVVAPDANTYIEL